MLKEERYIVGVVRSNASVPIVGSNLWKNPTEYPNGYVNCVYNNEENWLSFGGIGEFSFAAFSLVYLSDIKLGTPSLAKAANGDGISETISGAINAIFPDNTFSIASIIYAYMGIRNDINAYQLVNGVSLKEYFRFAKVGTFPSFLQYGDKLVFTPSTSSTGINISRYKSNFELDRTQLVNVIVKSADDIATMKRVTTIGDSFSAAAHWHTKVKELLGDKITFQGTVNGVTEGIYGEGRSGWNMAAFFSVSKNTTAGPNNPGYSPFMHPTVGTKIYQGVVEYNANTLLLNTYAVIKDALNWVGYNANGYPTNPTTDSVVYSVANARYETWDGSAWVNANLTDADFSFNFSKYIKAWKIVEHFGAAPDIVYVMLGMNDFRTQSSLSAIDTVYSSYKTKMNALIASVKSYNANIKIGVGFPNVYVGSDCNGSISEFSSRNNYNLYYAKTKVIADYDNRIGEGIYFIDWGLSIDKDYGYTHNTILSAPYNDVSQTLTYDVNTPHPSKEGYYSTAPQFAAWVASL